jgi:hypothetical protein
MLRTVKIAKKALILKSTIMLNERSPLVLLISTGHCKLVQTIFEVRSSTVNGVLRSTHIYKLHVGV